MAEDAGAPKAATAGRQIDLETLPEIAMENVLEKLKLLDYEAGFCAPAKPPWPLLDATTFAIPSPANNQNAQFFHFTSLTAWLLSKAGRSFPTPQQFDDPNTTCTNILTECKALGFAAPSFAPTKLKQGFGDAVCGVLEGLTDLVFERSGYKFKKPEYKAEPELEPEIVNDEDPALGTAAGGADAAKIDDDVEAEDDYEEDAYVQPSAAAAAAPSGPAADGGSYGAAAGGAAMPDDEATALMVSTVDAELWRQEVERVAPQLRVTTVADAKDWRSHVEQTHHYHRGIQKSFPEAKSALEKVRLAVEDSVEKLGTREKYINHQFENLTSEYRSVREQLGVVQEKYNRNAEVLAEKTNELARISEELEAVKLTMEERGETISDTSPLVKIKQAIKTLKAELQQMEVRIGVVEHTLLQKSVTSLQGKAASAPGSPEQDVEDEY